MVLTAEEVEETIYKITRAVYNRLGESADRKLVEAIVSDIFIELLPILSSPERSLPSLQRDPGEPPVAAQRFIVSVFGLDRPGIVAAVATMLGDANCNIIDMNQTVVQGKFAMIMIVDASRASKDV